MIIKSIVLFLIKLYRMFPRFLSLGQCRFIPSCSLYAEQCVLKFSLFRSVGLIFYRILRCNPLCSTAVMIDEIPR